MSHNISYYFLLAIYILFLLLNYKNHFEKFILRLVWCLLEAKQRRLICIPSQVSTKVRGSWRKSFDRETPKSIVYFLTFITPLYLNIYGAKWHMTVIHQFDSNLQLRKFWHNNKFNFIQWRYYGKKKKENKQKTKQQFYIFAELSRPGLTS